MIARPKLLLGCSLFLLGAVFVTPTQANTVTVANPTFAKVDAHDLTTSLASASENLLDPFHSPTHQVVSGRATSDATHVWTAGPNGFRLEDSFTQTLATAPGTVDDLSSRDGFLTFAVTQATPYDISGSITAIGSGDRIQSGVRLRNVDTSTDFFWETAGASGIRPSTTSSAPVRPSARRRVF